MKFTLFLTLVLFASPLFAGIKRDSNDDPAKLESVQQLETTARAMRTRLTILSEELLMMRRTFEIADPDPEKMSVLRPKQGRLQEANRYLQRKGDYLREKEAYSGVEERLRVTQVSP